ncbi:MAG TPA: signal peptidase I [Candidatus Didemnitutus sp.]|nr:signal peptidase I [Candidatus Didemnitutus sp.]
MNSWLSSDQRERATSWLKRQWREWRSFLFLFCFVWIPLRSSVIDYSPVPTGSMNPTVLEGDVVWVNKLAYGLRVPLTQTYLTRWAEPQRGDIVVVLSPLDGTRLVKRIVGVPGDTIALVDNRLLLNGQPVDYTAAGSDYGTTIAHKLQRYAFFAEENLGGVKHAVMGLQAGGGAQRTFGPVVVPPGRYFFMGDSRDNSRDSREIGFAARDAVLGRAKGILVSLDINDSYRLRTERFFSPLR